MNNGSRLTGMLLECHASTVSKLVSTSALTTGLWLVSSLAVGAQIVTPVATGLNSPRGLSFAPNGTLYVAEAGLGASDGHGGYADGVGRTGSITEIRGLGSGKATAKRLVTGLASVGTSENGGPEAVGPDGISVHGTGEIYVQMAESSSAILAENPSVDPAVASQFGKLLKVSPSGHWKVTADVGNYNYWWTDAHKNDPWAPAGQFPDANPYGVLAVAGHQYVADAGANTINEVRPNGSVRIIAYVPDPVLPLPGGGSVRISDSVPTCVARGPDGYLYVGTLAFGANFARFDPSAPPNWAALPPQSKVYRVNPNASEQFLTDQDVWAAGFNPITACGFGPNGFYVVEFVTQETDFITGDVVRVTINAAGSPGSRTAMGAGALHEPNGFAVGPDGSIYVSNFSISGGGGEVVRVNQ
jgi:hypothetical protein